MTRERDRQRDGRRDVIIANAALITTLRGQKVATNLHH